MLYHKQIVVFTLLFYFQLNKKSQNAAFHLKLFPDCIFDLVYEPH